MNGKQKEELRARFRKESHQKLHKGFDALKEIRQRFDGIAGKLTPEVLSSFPIDAPLLKKDVNKVLRILSRADDEMRGVSYRILTFGTF